MSWQANASAEVICSIAHHYYIRRGFKIIEVSDDTQLLDGNIERLTEEYPDKYVLRSASCGRPQITMADITGRNLEKIEIHHSFYNINK